MSHRLVTLGISSERDTVAVRQRAREISQTLGFGAQDQVRIATAVSELARSALAFAAGGKVEYSLDTLGRGAELLIRIGTVGADARAGRDDPNGLAASAARDEALASAARLMDSCKVEIGSDRSHSIVLGKALPLHRVVDAATLVALADRLAASPVASSFVEVTLQNKELLDTLAELRSKQDALLVLTDELEKTNRGVVALYAEIEEKAERLRQADVHKDEFLATLAHELRNPLAPIRNAVEVMRRVPPTNTASHARAQQIISRQVDHLARLVDDLLDVARISQGKVTLKQASVETGHIMHTAVETIQPFIDARGHTLSVTLPSAPLWVQGDAVRLAQIVGNLLNNAAKYTLRGGRIDLSAQRGPGQTVQISVRDNGIGLSEERMRSIFGMFAQGDTAPDRAQDGLGIGLSLVRQLVTLHGGRVWVESAGEGQGSCFIVELPLLPGASAADAVAPQGAMAPASLQPAHAQAQTVCPASLQDAAAWQAAREETTIAAASATAPAAGIATPAAAGLAASAAAGVQRPDAAGKRTVLLVDDNHDSVAMTAMLLQACGHATLIAHDASGAMALAAAHRLDIVLLDIGLPGTDGYTLARMLRSVPALQQVRLIAMTGYGTDEDRKKARDAGFDHHLVKPVDAALLIALVATGGQV